MIKLSISFQKIYVLLMYILATPIVLIIRLIRPIVLIRIGALWSSRIGHFAMNTELYLCKRDVNLYAHRSYNIFYHMYPICNLQLKKMWNRTLFVTNFARYVDRVNCWIPGGKSNQLYWEAAADRDIHGLLSTVKPHLIFTSEEKEFGKTELQKMGISDKTSFVCFFVRDENYLKTILPAYDWSFHSYRNGNIHNYIPALEYLISHNYILFRMGTHVKDPLPIIHPQMIDYSQKYRTDFLDIYLPSKCHFFIGDTSGIFAVFNVFRRPIVWVNYVPLEYAPSWGPNHIFIPKKLWLRQESRFLTFKEIIESGIGRFCLSQDYEKHGIDVIENTPEEIMSVVVEMDERLKGTWKTTSEDEDLQERFWYFFKFSKLNGVITARIGTDFLRQNQTLLG